MRFTKLGRFVGAFALAGSLTYVASAPASAASPSWQMTVNTVLDTVHTGSAAAFQVTIYNHGTSNISSLFLQSSIKGVAYVDDTTHCQGTATTTLFCNFGSLPGTTAGQPDPSVTITVAFTAGTTSVLPGFFANTTGASPNDKGGNSHGDTLYPTDPDTGAAVTPTTKVTTSKNFAGGFALDTSLVGTDTSLGKGNQQSTSVAPLKAHIPVTTQDGTDVTEPFSCTDAANQKYCGGKTEFGESSKVNVESGVLQPGYFPVTIMLYGKALPTGVLLSSIQLIHVDDQGNPVGADLDGDGVPDPLPQCGATLADCIQVTKVGNNYKIIAWVDQNGGFKGMG
jgi:hypothetical protein